MKKIFFFKILIFVILSCITAYAVNDLSVREDVSHPRVKPGYIDKAVLIIEPNGAYTEQSLFIEYSDHGQFPGQRVEILHKFEFPQEAVVHDLWLWIGDTISKAIIIQQWRAQEIYDSITSFKRDPAFLKVSNNQYDLCIYPLESGSYRKVKINYIAPTKFIGKAPCVDISYKFLACDNNTTTPLKILLRQHNNLWGNPKIPELPGIGVSYEVDTLGSHYSVIVIPDIKQVNSLTLTYDVPFVKGCNYSILKGDSCNYYTFGLYESEYFNTSLNNQGPKKRFIGLDLSGRFGIDPQDFYNNFAIFLPGYCKDGDTVRIIAAGEGLVDTLPSQGWCVADKNSLQLLLQEFKTGAVLSAKASVQKPKILLADSDDGGGWNYQGVNDLAEVTVGDHLMQAVPVMQEYDIVASYWHGLRDILSNEQEDTLEKELDIFFEKGGVFLTFFAYNRDHNHIARRYFHGLVKPDSFKPSYLKRNLKGIIGQGFPDNFFYHNASSLVNSDTGAVSELINDDDQPVVISKRIGKGLFILTGMWHMQDNEGTKRALCTTLLNLQNQSIHKQLNDVIQAMATSFKHDPFSEALLMSNSDHLITPENMFDRIPSLTDSATEILPIVNTVALLTGKTYTPPVFSTSSGDFLGSSYALQYLSGETGGMLLQRHIESWNYITYILALESQLQHELFDIAVTADGGQIPDKPIPILPAQLNYDRARFFIGKTPVCREIAFACKVKYKNYDSLFTNTTTVEADSLSSQQNDILETMYANEVLKTMFCQTPLDTHAIVKYAMNHRILNDFTAFIALEPSDTAYIISGEDNNNQTEVKQNTSMPQSEMFSFNTGKEFGAVHFRIKTGIPGTVTLRVFNLAGRVVYTRSIKSGAGHVHSISSNTLNLAKGVYVVVAQFIPQKGDTKNSNMRIIRRFTIVK